MSTMPGIILSGVISFLLLDGMAAMAAGTSKGDRELGEHLTAGCVSCHQLSGKTSGDIPAIVAWPEDQFVAVMMAYKTGARNNETMRVIAHRLSQEDIEALAVFFGSLPPPKVP